MPFSSLSQALARGWGSIHKWQKAAGHDKPLTMKLLFVVLCTNHQMRAEGRVMQISMQMRLATLKDAAWQVGAVGEGGGSLWKTCWAWSALASSAAMSSGGGDAALGGHSEGTWVLSVTSASRSAQSWGLLPSQWRVARAPHHPI